ncbi:ABC transporter permease [Azospirillum soli]|uniref:ABC transporter permease n=1 Tax=Azospirillum soli TaxID=1304799 RepID=UPI001AE6F67F|nr:ABC transporter permease subunit [Azospirillum soli]MBP2312950.1 peptide/nickel transport system permease protein [Azospirillum soli]
MSAAVLLALAAVAVAAPLIVPHDPAAVDLARAWAPPSPAHWLGCDALGRDVVSRLLLGARASLLVAAAAAVLATLLGVALGIVGSLAGRWAEAVVGHAVDVALAFPKLVLALVLVALLGPGVPATAAAIGLASWPDVARLTRALVAAAHREPYVRAAAACGAGRRYVLWRHVLPHIRAALLARAGALAAQAVLAEAALGFLGLGVQDPLPSWGGMIRDGLPVIAARPAMALAASLAVFTTALAVNLLVDGVRDAADPQRMR